MLACLCSRTILLELSHSLDTDSFLLAIREFIDSGGNIREMRSDNESNCWDVERTAEILPRHDPQ